MKNKQIYITLLFLSVFITGNLIITQSIPSQEKPSGWNSTQQDNQLYDRNKVPVNSLQAAELTPQVKVLLEQMKSAKAEGNINRVLEIRKQMDALTGESITVPLNSTAGEVITRSPGDNGDAVVNTQVFANPPGTFIKAMTTGVEQRGANIGRIWVAFAYGVNTYASPDTIKVYSSDNGGYSWSWVLTATNGSNAKVNYDEMDMEIMEYTTGQKYIWITDGVTTNTFQKISQVLILQTPTFAAGFYNLNWPGNVTSNNVYMPRITSDNSNYPTSSSYCFIVAGRDSTTSGGHFIGEKYAYCVNPFTTTPVITYRGPCYVYNVNYGNNPEYDNVDIAYYKNGGQDSIMVTESNLPDKSVIYCMKDGETGSNPVAFTSMNNGNTYAKQYARIVSNGNFALIMMAFRQNFNNSGDWDIVAARSVYGGILSAGWEYSYIDGFASTSTYPYQPDLWGPRGTLSFKCSYVYYGPVLDSAMVSSVGSSGTWDPSKRVNNTGQDVSYGASSHVCQTGSGDCFSVWSNYAGLGGDKVWAANGCSAPFVTGTGNNNNQIPVIYSLSQNYPNPFNPSTKISFAMPETGIVKLEVYDITGKQVAVLVNGQIEAGKHSIDFDASRLSSGVYIYKLTANDPSSSSGQVFIDTKKMVLLK